MTGKEAERVSNKKEEEVKCNNWTPDHPAYAFVLIVLPHNVWRYREGHIPVVGWEVGIGCVGFMTGIPGRGAEHGNFLWSF